MTPQRRQAVLSMFTSATAKGNPAGVVVTAERLPFEERVKLAQEIAQPATAYISHPSIFDPSADFTSPPVLSWTRGSGQPLPLCGHGTAAAAEYLLGHVLPGAEKITFDYHYGPTAESEGKQGTITALREGNKFGIDLPAAAAAPELISRTTKAGAAGAFIAAANLPPETVVAVTVSESGYPEEGLRENVIIQLDPAVDLAALEIDYDQLMKLPFRGIWVVSFWPEARDSAFRSRIFFPKTGLLEDKVCGSAHTFLVPWLVSTYPEEFERWREGEGYRVPVDQVSPAGGKMEIVWDGKWRKDGGRCILMGEGIGELSKVDVLTEVLEES